MRYIRKLVLSQPLSWKYHLLDALEHVESCSMRSSSREYVESCSMHSSRRWVVVAEPVASGRARYGRRARGRLPSPWPVAEPVAGLPSPLQCSIRSSMC
jgi:hypothetical protein